MQNIFANREIKEQLISQLINNKINKNTSVHELLCYRSPFASSLVYPLRSCHSTLTRENNAVNYEFARALIKRIQRSLGIFCITPSMLNFIISQLENNANSRILLEIMRSYNSMSLLLINNI